MITAPDPRSERFLRARYWLVQSEDEVVDPMNSLLPFGCILLGIVEYVLVLPVVPIVQNFRSDVLAVLASYEERLRR